jgi:hypothetical protein
MGRGIVLLIAVLVSGCGPQGDIGPTPFPLPPGATALALATQSPRPSDQIGCVLLPPESVTMNWDAKSHAVSFSFNPWGDRASNTIIWPHGFSAREYQGRAELVAPDGHIVARAGDATVEVVWVEPEAICSVNGTIY